MNAEDQAKVENLLKRMEELNVEVAEMETMRRNVEQLRLNGQLFPQGAEERYQKGLAVLLRTLRQVEDGITASLKK